MRYKRKREKGRRGCEGRRRTETAVKHYLEMTPLVAHTSKTLTRADDLLAEIDRIRRQGYAVDDEERSAGVRCVAASVRDHQGRFVGAVSVSGASQRIDNRRVQDLSRIVTSAALEISSELGFSDQ